MIDGGRARGASWAPACAESDAFGRARVAHGGRHLAKYDLAGAKRHRKQIREALGFRPATLADEEQLTAWLAGEVCPVELVEDRQREALLVECRERKIEPPGRTRIERVLVAARGRWEKAFCTRTIERLGDAGTARLLALVGEDNEDGTALLAALKRDPGAVGLDSLLTEITKLNDVRRLGLPDGLFADCSKKLLAAWRARAIKMYPSDFRDTAEDVRITLLAALCSSRQAEITDALVDLLVALVQKINARTERRVERHLTAELRKVRGKEGILFKLADAAIGKPDEHVRTAPYPVSVESGLSSSLAFALVDGDDRRERRGRWDSDLAGCRPGWRGDIDQPFQQLVERSLRSSADVEQFMASGSAGPCRESGRGPWCREPRRAGTCP
ncbi:DUF4158 domain-containing protein [Streptomyces caeni]|uniref:DUF4158 domain-containing protein n=1 Tax=Streptomyces caeni TaxID=2307231 RepID=A0ABW4IMG3_9ACTN